MFGTLEFLDTGLETCDGFAEELCTCFSLAIVILTEVLFLCTDALLAGRLCAIAALWREDDDGEKKERKERITIFLFLQRE